MSAESIGWHDEQDQDDRRRVRNAVYVSVGVHVVLFAALVISPPVSFDRVPQSIAVELVAGPPIAAPAAPRPAPRRRPAPPPPAPEPAVEEAAPEPPPEPAPPIPKAPVQVLAENEPKPQKKVKQAPEQKPKEVAKVETKPKSAKEPVKEPAKQPDKSLSYDDAMKSLDEELGEDETEDLLAPPPSRPAQRPVAESGGSPESRAGASVNPEDAAWGLATRRRIQSTTRIPSNYSGRGLVTVLAIELTATGDVTGEPEVVRTSGDPYFDDFAVKGVLMAKPLPVPPRAGRLILIFPSEEN